MFPWSFTDMQWGVKSVSWPIYILLAEVTNTEYWISQIDSLPASLSHILETSMFSSLFCETFFFHICCCLSNYLKKTFKHNSEEQFSVYKCKSLWCALQREWMLDNCIQACSIVLSDTSMMLTNQLNFREDV
jgi:hypothetical protein